MHAGLVSPAKQSRISKQNCLGFTSKAAGPAETGRRLRHGGKHMSGDGWGGFLVGWKKLVLAMTCPVLLALPFGSNLVHAQTVCPLVTAVPNNFSLAGTDQTFDLTGGAEVCVFSSAENCASVAATPSRNVVFRQCTAPTPGVQAFDNAGVLVVGNNYTVVSVRHTGGVAAAMVNIPGAVSSGFTNLVPTNAFTLNARIRRNSDNQLFDIAASKPAGSGIVNNNPEGWDAGAATATAVVNTAPVIGSNGGAATAAVTVEENQTAITNVEATDDFDAESDGLTYSITGGVDQALFAVDANTGELTFNAAPDFEAPVDNGGNNVYEIQITVTDTSAATDVQDVTVSVANVVEDGGRSGTVTIIKKTSPVVAGDGTFTFASDAGGLNGLSLATSGNSAISAAIIVNAGAVAVTEDVLPGWKLSTIACTGDADSGSVVDVANRRVTIDVDANEAIVCTFTNVRDPDSVIRETQRVISNFMSERADVIVSNDPDLADRFRTGGSNGQGNPLGFAAQGDARDIELSFATSLRAMRRAANAGAKRTVEGIGADPGVETAARFDIWAQGTYARVDSIDRKSDVGLLHTGFDYRFSDNLLFGLLGQLDWTDQRERSTNTRTSADGVGWLIGPYLAARIHQNLILDGRAAWGQSYNNVNPLGLYEDDFNTNRWLVRGQLTGDFAWGNWTFNPSAGISYFSEKQKSYVDSLNITIPSQTITLGRAEAGPEVRYNLQTKDGWQFAPHVGVKGIWDFDPANIVTAQGVTIDSSGLRARAEGGTVLIMPWGWSLNGTGFYDGIGAKDFQSYGGSVKVKVPLN